MSNFRKMKRWELVFKALANENRLLIIEMLTKEGKKTVTEISNILDISMVATSRHLIILRNFEVLLSTGKDGHVFYDINSGIPEDFKRILKTVLEK